VTSSEAILFAFAAVAGSVLCQALIAAVMIGYDHWRVRQERKAQQTILEEYRAKHGLLR